MLTVKSKESQPPEIILRDRFWSLNLLDWSPIDRLIILCFIFLLYIGFYIAGISLALYLQAFYFTDIIYINVGLSYYMVVVLSCLWLVLLCFTVSAFLKRTRANDWPALGGFIIFSYVTVSIFIGFLTGTFYSDTIVLLLVGFALCLPLANLDMLSKGFVFAWLTIMFLIIADLLEIIPFAPIFTSMTHEAQHPSLGFTLARVVTVVTVFIILYVVTLPAVKRWKEREELYIELSCTDGLTKLTNRRSFIQRCHTEFSRSQRIPQPLALIMIDLDFFKKVNDNYGHLAGDSVLVQTAAVLVSNARDYDAVGRYGGEEFVILLPNTDKATGVKIAEKIRSLIEALDIKIENKILKVTGSFGVASYPEDNINDVNELLKKADMALYEAKDQGRNTVAVCN